MLRTLTWCAGIETEGPETVIDSNILIGDQVHIVLALGVVKPRVANYLEGSLQTNELVVVLCSKQTERNRPRNVVLIF